MNYIQKILTIASVFLVSQCAAGTFVQEKSQNKTLVLVDTWATLETHSIFFDHIQQMGGGNHTLEFKLISGASETVNIQKFNKYFYDNIILMAPTAKSFGQDLSVKDILEFVDFHHNIMVFLNNQSRKISRELANAFGIDFEDIGFSMQAGTVQNQASAPAHAVSNVAWSQNLFEPLARVFSVPERPILFEDGVGAVLDTPKRNQHVFPILRADQGSYSYHGTADEDQKRVGVVSGNQLALVAGYQTMYNQRAVFSGSFKMCSNSAMLATRDPELGTIQSSSNYKLCTEMVEWNLQERGVLKVDNVRHRKVGDPWTGANPENYKRQVDIEYFVDIYAKHNGQWVPYVADDVQFQFTMLDPYY